MIGVFFPSPLNTKPVKNEQELLRDCSKFCEAAYLPLDKDTGALEKYGIEETYYNWERRSNRAITFTTKLNLSSLYSTENETFTEERVPVTVVAFRGTSNLSEILEDLKSYKAVQLYSESLREIVSTTTSDTADLKNLNSDIKYKYLCSAGDGFVVAYKDLRSCRRYRSITTTDGVTTATYTTFISDICKLSKDTCEGRLLVVGHSLGGAMAQLFASEVSLCEPDLKIGLVTFGMPRTLANGETEEELAAAAAAALDRANESLTAAEAAPAAAGGALKNDSNGFYAGVFHLLDRCCKFVYGARAPAAGGAVKNSDDDAYCQKKFNYPHIRVVNRRDPVPSLPLSSLGFSHKATKVVHFKNDRKEGGWHELKDTKIAEDFDGLDGIFQFFYWSLDSHRLSAHNNPLSYIARLSVKTVPYSYYEDYIAPAIVFGSVLALTTTVGLYLVHGADTKV